MAEYRATFDVISAPPEVEKQYPRLLREQVRVPSSALAKALEWAFFLWEDACS